jgi:hypothetical protein
VSALVVEPGDATTTAWVAAFALGLAYVDRPEPAKLAELREAVGDRDDLLDRARERLDVLEVADVEVRVAAIELLERARTPRLSVIA